VADLKLSLIIDAVVKGAKEIGNLTGSIKQMGATATKKVPDNTDALRIGADKTKLSVQDLTQAIGGLVTIGAITQFARSAVQEFAKAESALRGLEAVANASGVGIGNAMREAEQLAADGLLGVADASKALQNLLARGYNLDQAVDTINRLKDASAFNRQAALSMSEAVVGATEGLKNENSMLVDNAGVTKNVAKMWADYAAIAGKTTEELTQAEKIQAEVNGILTETAAQAGNAQKALAGFQGDMARADQAAIKFKQALGESLAPAMAGLASAGTAVINGFFKPLIFLAQAAGVRIAQVGLAFGAIWDAATSLDFSRLKETVRVQGELAEKEIQDIARRLSSDSLKLADSLSGGADPAKAKEVADRLTAGGKAAGEAAKAMAGEVKKAVESSIQDYQRLAEAARTAWQQSLDQEKTYRDQAAALRAKADIKPKDSSIEGQASAMLDVINAEQKLQRLQAGPDLEATQRQAELVRQLAGNLENQARAQEAISRANAGEATALDAAAEQEKTRQAGLQEQWKKSEQTVKDLQTALESIGKGTAINIESDAAQAVLDAITAKLAAIKDKTVKVTVVAANAGGAPLDNLALPGKAAGGAIVGPGGPTADKVLMLGSNGEHMLTAAEVRAAGGHAAIYRLRAAIKAGMLPRFASGGAVMSATQSLSTLPTMSSSAPDFPHLGRIDIGLGGQTHAVYAEPDVARALRSAALKVGSR